jgi:hypothetical protein
MAHWFIITFVVWTAVHALSSSTTIMRLWPSSNANQHLIVPVQFEMVAGWRAIDNNDKNDGMESLYNNKCRLIVEQLKPFQQLYSTTPTTIHGSMHITYMDDVD